MFAVADIQIARKCVHDGRIFLKVCDSPFLRNNNNISPAGGMLATATELLVGARKMRLQIKQLSHGIIAIKIWVKDGKPRSRFVA